MFISKAEKMYLVGSIKLLQEQVRDLTAKVVMMGNFPEARKEKKRTMSPESRAKISAMMKKRHADAKAKKENT
jgi:hypothetical protein